MAGARGEYRKSAGRRAQILDAAHTVFARGGYSAASVSEIARAVGMTQAGVLHHFAGGKVALLRAVLEQRDHAAEDVLSGRQGRDFLRGLVEITTREASRRGYVQLYTVLSAEATDPEHPAHGYFADRFTRITDAVTVAFEQVQQEGGLREGATPRRAALAVSAMIEGLELLWLNGLDVDMAEDSRRHISSFLVEPI